MAIVPKDMSMPMSIHVSIHMYLRRRIDARFGDGDHTKTNLDAPEKRQKLGKVVRPMGILDGYDINGLTRINVRGQSDARLQIGMHVVVLVEIIRVAAADVDRGFCRATIKNPMDRGNAKGDGIVDLASEERLVDLNLCAPGRHKCVYCRLDDAGQCEAQSPPVFFSVMRIYESIQDGHWTRQRVLCACTVRMRDRLRP